MGLRCGLLLHLACSLGISNAFLTRKNLQPASRRSVFESKRLFGSLDYEYYPPNDGNGGEASFATNLSSSYPPGTPAGLRGEAIRSAIRSDRCLAWNLAGTPLEHGVVQVTGQGALNFLNNKFTQSFVWQGSLSSRSSSSSFKEACLLTAKGRLVDRVGIAVTDAATGYMLTSPGHKSKALFDRLDPFIFPLDKVALHDCGSKNDSSCVFSLASLKREHIQSCFDRFILPQLGLNGASNMPYTLPLAGKCLKVPINAISGAALVVLPTSGLPVPYK